MSGTDVENNTYVRTLMFTCVCVFITYVWVAGCVYVDTRRYKSELPREREREAMRVKRGDLHVPLSCDYEGATLMLGGVCPSARDRN